jgi:hypothetical protein
MKKIILLLLPLFSLSQQCYTVTEVISTTQIEEMSNSRITFGIKQMTEEILSDKYDICQQGIPVSVDVFSIEAPSKAMSLGPFAKNKKQTIVKIKVTLGQQEYYGEGLAQVSSQSMFLDLSDDTLPFSATSFSSAVKKALESIIQ